MAALLLIKMTSNPMYLHLRTVSRTSSTGWAAARWSGSQPWPSNSLKAKVCLSISLSTDASPGHYRNDTAADVFYTKTRNNIHHLLVFMSLSLFIICLSECQPLNSARLLSPTAADPDTVAARLQRQIPVDVLQVVRCDVTPTLLDGSQDSQFFIRHCV